MIKFIADWLSMMSAAAWVAAYIGGEEVDALKLKYFGTLTFVMALVVFKKGEKDGN